MCVCALILFYLHTPFTSGDLIFEYKDAHAMLYYFLVLLLNAITKPHHTTHRLNFFLYLSLHRKAPESLCNNQTEKKPAARAQILCKWAMTSQIKKTVYISKLQSVPYHIRQWCWEYLSMSILVLKKKVLGQYQVNQGQIHMTQVRDVKSRKYDRSRFTTR